MRAHYNRKRKYSSAFRNAIPAAIGVGTRLYNAYKRSRTVTQTRNPKQNVRTMTRHFDRSVQYRRRRMPYRKRKAWQRFYRKVVHVQMKQDGIRNVVLNDNKQLSIGADTQGMYSYVMYGMKANVGSAGVTQGYNDISRIITADTVIGTAVDKIQFNSACLDMTYSNTGTATIELDVYEFYVRRDNDNVTAESNLNYLLTASPNIGAGLTVNTVGVTPFQVPQVGQYYRITKKTKFFVPPSEQMTYQLRDARDRRFNTSDLAEEVGTSMQKRGWTRGILLVHKGVPDATHGAANISWSAGCTRTYSYYHVARHQAADGPA